MSKDEEIALKLTIAMIEGIGKAGDTPNNPYEIVCNYKIILEKLRERSDT